MPELTTSRTIDYVKSDLTDLRSDIIDPRDSTKILHNNVQIFNFEGGNIRGEIKNALENIIYHQTNRIYEEIVFCEYINDAIVPISRGGTNSGTALINNRVMVSDNGKIVESDFTISEIGDLIDPTEPVPGSLWEKDYNDGYIYPTTSSDNVYIINKLGVGTFTPQAKLSVNGGVNIGADADPGDNNLNVVNNAIINGNIGVGINSPSSLIEIYSNSENPIVTVTAAHNSLYDPQIRFRAGSTPSTKWTIANDSGNSHVLKFLSEGDVDSGNSVWNIKPDGFTGINTITPLANLHIKGASWAYSAATGIIIQSIDGGVSEDTAPGLIMVDKNWVGGNPSQCVVGMATEDEAWVYEAVNGDMLLRSKDGGIGFGIWESGISNARMKMFMDNDGKFIIGHGQTNPVSTLEISTDGSDPIMTITSRTDSSYDPQLQFRTGTSPAVRFSFGVDSTNDYSKWLPGTGLSGTNGIIMDSSGNVGINEGAPQDKLEVNGTILVKDKLKFTQDDGNEYIDSENDGDLDIVATTNIDLYGNIRAGDGGGTDYIQISNTGNITFNGSSGFYPRVLSQASEPGVGTGLTQIDSGEIIMWIDTDDSNRCYVLYNNSGTVIKNELT